MSDREPAGEGAARRRRERRLRQWARHEKLSVQMALSEYKHHSSRGQRKDRAGGEVRVVPHGGVPEAPLPQGGSRPPCLGVPRGPHVGMVRHIVEDLGGLAPTVQILDDPMPQMVDSVLEFFRALDLPVGEQVIAVPKISTDRVSQRLVERHLPQMVEQLVHVPTVLSPLRIAEEIVGIPAPQRGGNWSLQGPLPGQVSTFSPLPERISERIVEQIAVPSPVERISQRIVEQIVVSSPAERISERTVEQIVDISPGDDRGQRSSSSAGPADEDFQGVFRTFSPRKKVRSAGQVSADLPRHVSSSTPAAYEASNGSDEWIQLTDDEFRTYYWNRRSGESVWRSPAGVEVVWVGVKDDEGDFWYRHRRTGVSTYVLPPLPPG